jgi:glyoxylate reductase
MQKIPVMGDGLPPALVELLGPTIEVLPWDASPNSAALSRAVGMITYGHPLVDGPFMDRMPHLTVISNHGVGVDHIDLAAAQARRIPVGNTPGCLDAATADMTMALLLAAARNVVVGDRFARGPEFMHYDPAVLIGQEVTGSTLGIIGMGRIGKQVARRRRDRAAEADLGVAYASFDELLSQSDFISLNCPLTAETTGLISTAEFGRMKPGAILINISRGPVVDGEALYEALASRRIAAAAIDVTAPEPLPRDHKLLSLDNLVITPHLGSASNRTRRRMVEMTIENLLAGLEGRELLYPCRAK